MMKAKPRRMWVIECPSCHYPVDFTGEDGIYFRTKSDAEAQAQLWLGTAGNTLTEICGCSQVRKTR